MGRAAKLKRIRKIVENLPALEVVQVHGSKVYGNELIDQGIEKDVDGKKINQKTLYRNKKKVNTPMNHDRNLKRMYDKFGLKGIDTYVKAVDKHVKGQKEVDQAGEAE